MKFGDFRRNFGQEPSWWERAGMELPNTIVKLKDIATFDGTDGVWRLD